MRKVELAVMKPWIAKKVVELLGLEDEVLIEYINSLLEDADNPVVDAKKMQHALTGFLQKQTPTFMQQLWELLLSAQSNPLKVPTQLLEEKKKEMRAREEAEAVKRRAEEANNERLAAIRQRERGGRDDRRGGGRGGGPGRGSGRGGYGYDRGGDRGGPPGRGGYRGDGGDRRGPGPPPRRYYEGDREDRPREQFDRRDDDRRGGKDSYRDMPVAFPLILASATNTPHDRQDRRRRVPARGRSRSITPKGRRDGSRSPSPRRNARGDSRSPPRRRRPAAGGSSDEEDERRVQRKRVRSRSPGGGDRETRNEDDGLQRRESELKEGLLRKKLMVKGAAATKFAGGDDE
ncbi:hypothetical protein OIO90_002131 [Microbotryomycetes sp. JL221]|nr:hypothetical protein OIO90_002131 [Microbotryomycetes sp. JL221]